MRSTLIAARCAVVLGVVAPLLALRVNASDSADSQGAATAEVWQGAVTVNNPFVKAGGTMRPNGANAEGEPAQPGPTAGPLLDAAVDDDAPAVYRLPNVSRQAADPLAASLDEIPRLDLAPGTSCSETQDSEAHRSERSLLATPPRAVRIRVAQCSDADKRPPDVSDAVPFHADSDPAVRVGMPPVVRQKGVPQSTDDIMQAASQYLQMYTPTTHELTQQLLPVVQRAFQLAQRGALYAAETEFVQVLRRIAQAHDAAAGDDRHARALAAGLRALEEAADFVPTGNQVEAELDVPIVASSHRTPVLRDYPHRVLPHEAVALYHHFAEQQLAAAVAGEQAGSMALHGLGRIGVLQAARQDDDAHGQQRAMTMFSAAIAARADNHLAANELGVLLCQVGRPVEAARVFERTIDMAPSALAYHNLAVAQRKLGMHGQADANEQESQRLAAQERANGVVSRRMGVQWVSREELAQVSQPAPLASAYHASRRAGTPANSPTAASPADSSTWQQAVKIAKSLPLPGIGGARSQPGPAAAASTSRPTALARPSGATQWR